MRTPHCRAATGSASPPGSGWPRPAGSPALAADAARNPQRKRSCILLWMNGGPATIDMFDLKPGHANGGPFKEIDGRPRPADQRAPAEARQARQAPGRRPVDDHQGGRPRPGHLPDCAPATCRRGRSSSRRIGSLVSKELGDPTAELPNFVSVAPFRRSRQGAFGPGFLGPQYAPLIVGETATSAPPQPGENADRSLRVQDLDRPRDVAAGTGRVAARPAQGPGTRLRRRPARRSSPRATRPPTTGPSG